MEQKDIIVIGASAGGIEALKALVADLPADLPAAVFVVVHIGAYGLGILPELLQKAGPLPAKNAVDWERFRHGRIYVAPPDRHLVLDPRGFTRITRGPKENLCRPAVDPLFRSAAFAYGPRVIGVVLTGYLDDGTAGLWAIKEQGGTAVVQHPVDALAPSMPRSALQHVDVDYCVTLKEMPKLLAELAAAPANLKGESKMSKQMEAEVQIAQEDKATGRGLPEWGEPSIYACPECHGVLLRLKEGSNIRFRCHTGHAYSLETLLAEFAQKNEETLWNAIRSIEETTMLLRNMAEHLQQHEHEAAAERLLRQADEAQARAKLVREAVMQHRNVAVEEQAAKKADAAAAAQPPSET